MGNAAGSAFVRIIPVFRNGGLSFLVCQKQSEVSMTTSKNNNTNTTFNTKRGRGEGQPSRSQYADLFVAFCERDAVKDGIQLFLGDGSPLAGLDASQAHLPPTCLEHFSLGASSISRAFGLD